MQAACMRSIIHEDPRGETKQKSADVGGGGDGGGGGGASSLRPNSPKTTPRTTITMATAQSISACRRRPTTILPADLPADPGSTTYLRSEI